LLLILRRLLGCLLRCLRLVLIFVRGSWFVVRFRGEEGAADS
jgi:hypothetical protein